MRPAERATRPQVFAGGKRPPGSSRIPVRRAGNAPRARGEPPAWARCGGPPAGGLLAAGLALVTDLSVAAALATHLGPALRPVSLFATPIRQVAALVGVGGYRPLRFHPHHVVMATVMRYIAVVLVSLLTPRWAYRRRVA
jgi:hypothetical protein